MTEKPYTDEDVLYEMYAEQRMSTREIADEFGCSNSTIVRWLGKHDINARDRHDIRLPGERGYDVGEEDLSSMYWDRKMSMQEIGEELDVDSSTVERWLRAYNIETRSIGTWKRYEPPSFRTHIKGYEQIRSQHEGDYDAVYVHRLFAVAEYGFDAVRDMHVHHRDEIPWDNRSENLELLTPSDHARHHHGPPGCPKAKTQTTLSQRVVGI